MIAAADVAGVVRASNPFVGPGPFSRTDSGVGRHLYGRETEVEALFNLLITERLALLYSPSGAGKTSLIEARLVPRLEAEGLFALPTARVGLHSDAIADEAGPVGNRYIRSALSTLGANRSEWTMSLAEFLDRRRAVPDDPQLVIFDQFEEVLVQDPTDLAAKEAFFQELGAALRDPNRWALLSIREDYVAGLDPFLRFMPIRPGARFRLDLLGARAARQAIVQPGRDSGVDLAPVADRLVRELSMMRVQQADGRVDRQPGPYIEPVQLQVVCVRLWSQFAPATSRVSEEDVQAIGDVDQALAQYYADSVESIAADTAVDEQRIREWVGDHLLTHQRVRGQVLQDVDDSEGLPNRAIFALVDAHLVRAERRRGFTWFELAHDRFIEPVLENNRSWFQVHLNPLQQRAAIWDRDERPAGLLLSERQLIDAEDWAKGRELLPREANFLVASRNARLAAARGRMRFLARALVATVLVLLAVVVALFAAISKSFSDQEKTQAAALLAQQNASNDLAAAARAQLTTDPVLSGLLAVQAADHATTQQASDALRAVGPVLHQQAQVTHDAPVAAVAISPDGQTMASASTLGDIRLSDLRTGELRQQLPREGSAVQKLAFSPDGSLLAAAGNAGLLRLFDTRSGDLRFALPVPVASIVAVAFSPDGRLLASASRDGTARLWDTRTGAASGAPLEHKRTCNTCDPSVVDVAFDHTGTRLLTASWNNSARVWDVKSGQQTLVLNSAAAVLTAAWSTDNRRILTGGFDKTVRLWDAGSGGKIGPDVSMPDPVLRVSFSPDGRLAAAVTGRPDQPVLPANEQARTWDSSTLNFVQQMTGHTGAIIAGLFDPDGTRLVTASWDGTARIWNSHDGTLVGQLVGHTGRILDAALSPDGRVVVTGSEDMTARVWTTTPEFAESHWAAAVPVVKASFNSTDTQLALTSSDGSVRLWQVESRSVVDLPPQLQSDRATTSALFSPDHRHLVTVSTDGRALGWDLWTGGPPVAFDAQAGPVLACAVSASGAYIATSNADGTLHIWDAAVGTQVGVFRAASYRAIVLAFTPDANELISIWGDGSVRRWQWGADRSERAMDNLPLPMTSVAMSSTAMRIVTGDPTGHVRVWDISSGRLVANLEGPNAPVSAVDLSPDGAFALSATGSFEPPTGGNAAMVWDVSAGQLAATLPGDPAIFTSAVFSPDGQFVALSVANSERSERVYRWRLSQSPVLLADWIQSLVDRTNRTLSPAELAKFGLTAPAARQ